MPTNDDRQSREHVRELARGRMQNHRKTNREERLPSTREIDNALRDGLTIFLAANNLHRRKDALGHPTIGPIIKAAYRELDQARFDTRHRKTRMRFWRRLGIFE